jgi:hypothetical protein
MSARDLENILNGNVPDDPLFYKVDPKTGASILKKQKEHHEHHEHHKQSIPTFVQYLTYSPKKEWYEYLSDNENDDKNDDKNDDENNIKIFEIPTTFAVIPELIKKHQKTKNRKKLILKSEPVDNHNL